MVTVTSHQGSIVEDLPSTFTIHNPSPPTELYMPSPDQTRLAGNVHPFEWCFSMLFPFFISMFDEDFLAARHGC